MARDAPKINPLGIPLDMGARLRVSGGVLDELGWSAHKEDFQCFGILRAPEELLCVPEWLRTDEDVHPLERALEMVEHLKSAPPVDLLAVPTLDVLALRYRVFMFAAVWHPPKKVQLDLKIGINLAERLSIGEQPGSRSRRAFAAIYGGMLILASERHGTEVMKTDLVKII